MHGHLNVRENTKLLPNSTCRAGGHKTGIYVRTWWIFHSIAVCVCMQRYLFYLFGGNCNNVGKNRRFLDWGKLLDNVLATTAMWACTSVDFW